MSQNTATPKQTPLSDRHRAMGARMVEFGGWEMPLEYTGIAAEHLAVRHHAGLFDVSHMGEVEVAGADALEAVQRMTCNDAAVLDVGQIQYSALTTHDGTFVDDLLVYRLSGDHFLLVINASNIDKDYAWIKKETAEAGDAVAVNASGRYALLALQGPRAQEILQALTGVDLEALQYYRFATGEVAGARATISRTGYTGEDGFELYVAPQMADRVWTSVLDAGASAGLRAAGLGARDTLRLEAAMRLYGSDMDETTTVLEAGLGWTVAWDKGDFNGKEALSRQRTDGLNRKLVGFEMLDRGIARHGYDTYVGSDKVGTVTSGTQTPFLKKAIGMAYMPIDASTPDSEMSVDVRGRHLLARVVRMPFYKRPGN